MKRSFSRKLKDIVLLPFDEALSWSKCRRICLSTSWWSAYPLGSCKTLSCCLSTKHSADQTLFFNVWEYIYIREHWYGMRLQHNCSELSQLNQSVQREKTLNYNWISWTQHTTKKPLDHHSLKNQNAFWFWELTQRSRAKAWWRKHNSNHCWASWPPVVEYHCQQWWVKWPPSKKATHL